MSASLIARLHQQILLPLVLSYCDGQELALLARVAVWFQRQSFLSYLRQAHLTNEVSWRHFCIATTSQPSAFPHLKALSTGPPPPWPSLSRHDDNDNKRAWTLTILPSTSALQRLHSLDLTGDGSQMPLSVMEELFESVGGFPHLHHFGFPQLSDQEPNPTLEQQALYRLGLSFADARLFPCLKGLDMRRYVLTPRSFNRFLRGGHLGHRLRKTTLPCLTDDDEDDVGLDDDGTPVSAKSLFSNLPVLLPRLESFAMVAWVGLVKAIGSRGALQRFRLHHHSGSDVHADPCTVHSEDGLALFVFMIEEGRLPHLQDISITGVDSSGGDAIATLFKGLGDGACPQLQTLEVGLDEPRAKVSSDNGGSGGPLDGKGDTPWTDELIRCCNAVGFPGLQSLALHSCGIYQSEGEFLECWQQGCARGLHGLALTHDRLTSHGVASLLSHPFDQLQILDLTCSQGREGFPVPVMVQALTSHHLGPHLVVLSLEGLSLGDEGSSTLLLSTLGHPHYCPWLRVLNLSCCGLSQEVVATGGAIQSGLFLTLESLDLSFNPFNLSILPSLSTKLQDKTVLPHLEELILKGLGRQPRDKTGLENADSIEYISNICQQTLACRERRLELHVSLAQDVYKPLYVM